MLCWVFPVPTVLLSKVAWEVLKTAPGLSWDAGGRPWRAVITFYLYAGLP